MILLLGGSGFVGAAYQRYLQTHNLAYRNVRRCDSDYTQPATLITLLQALRPSFLINCAGYTGKPNVDACELHKAECLAGNAVLPGIIRQACAETGTLWGHVSSGCIYRGEKQTENRRQKTVGGNQPTAISGQRSEISGQRAEGRGQWSDDSGFRETDAPNFTFRTNNCSFYSGSKALGEEVLAGAQNCYIWRLRIPFNNIDNPRNYLTKVMQYERLLEARNSLSQLDEFVRATVECWQQRVPYGIYNVTNPGFVTTHEVVELIRKRGVIKKDFQFFKDEDEFMRLAAKTPRSNCVLDTTKLQRAGIQMTQVHEAVERALREWKTA